MTHGRLWNISPKSSSKPESSDRWPRPARPYLPSAASSRSRGPAVLSRPCKAVFGHANEAAASPPAPRRPQLSRPRGTPGPSALSGRAGDGDGGPPRPGGSPRTSRRWLRGPARRAGPAGTAARSRCRCRPVPALRKRRGVGTLPRLASQPLALRSRCRPAGPRPLRRRSQGRRTEKEEQAAGPGTRRQHPGRGPAARRDEGSAQGTRALRETHKVPSAPFGFPRSHWPRQRKRPRGEQGTGAGAGHSPALTAFSAKARKCSAAPRGAPETLR